MAEVLKTAAELLKVNDRNLADIEVSDILNAAPLVAQLPFVPSSNGTQHKYTKETTAPVVAFRAENVGKETKVSVDTVVTQALKILDAGFHKDKAVADAYWMGPEAYLAREARRHLRQALFALESQILNGTVGGDANGFEGLADETTLDAVADDRVVDATGDAADSASSAYLIRVGEDAVAGVVGRNDGAIQGDESLINMGEAYETVTTRDNKDLDVYRVPAVGYGGYQLGSINNAVRIANLTSQTGKGLTDALIYAAYERFPAALPPTHLVINRQSAEQLRASRVATNVTGAAAPLVREIENVQIIVTDALSTTEAVLA